MKSKVLILSVMKGTFTNQNTQQNVGYTRTIIASKGKQSENSLGYEIEYITGNVSQFDIVKQYLGKEVEVEFEFQSSDGKTYKKKFVQIGDVKLA